MKLMAEYGVEYPLWEDGKGLVTQERDELQRELGVSEELLRGLASWQIAWEARTDRFSGRLHQKTGRDLVRRMRSEGSNEFAYRLWRPSLGGALRDRFRAIFVEPLWRFRHGRPPDWPEG